MSCSTQLRWKRGRLWNRRRNMDPEREARHWGKKRPDTRGHVCRAYNRPGTKSRVMTARLRSRVLGVVVEAPAPPKRGLGWDRMAIRDGGW